MNPAGRTLSITVTEEGKQFHVDMGANLPTTIATIPSFWVYSEWKSRKGGSGVVSSDIGNK